MESHVHPLNCPHHPSKEPPKFADTDQRVFTCPMHPEIEKIGPGFCPICGMSLEPKEVSLTEEDDSELVDFTRRFWLGAALSLPVVAIAMSEMIPGFHQVHELPFWFRSYGQLAFTAPVVIYAGWPLVVRGISSLRLRKWNMFTLILLGTWAAFLFSALVTFLPGMIPETLRVHGLPPLYYESAAVITTLVLLGQVLELKARKKTSGAIRSLLKLAAKSAHRVAANGEEEEVPIEKISLGDRLRIKPGEKVPTDGLVEQGATHIDESMLTGESDPVKKEVGAAVFGATVNGHGTIVMRATRVGQETLLSQIVAMVAKAQRSRAPIQRLADRVSEFFVPMVVVVAVVSAIVWALWGPEPRLLHGFVNAVAVLIIACPCALGLATPISIMVGTGRGARAGILIKDAAALETLGKVDTLVLDKTGTLTEGKPVVTEVRPVGISSDELLTILAAVEKSSEHPLAVAVTDAAGNLPYREREVTDFQVIPGRGIEAKVDGRLILAGSAQFLIERGVTLVGDLKSANILAAREGEFIGSVGVRDAVKSSASAALEYFKRNGVEVIMVTGDNRIKAEEVSRELGILRFESGVLPADKASVIRKLQSEGRTVAMAGDGINDGPALASAHIGIAMGGGTDVAMESAGLTLIKGDLTGLVRAHRLSLATMRNIRQNLVFAFIYNFLGVPVAAGVLYPAFGLLLSPMMASAAMSISSVSVIVNALRLSRIRL